jgi:hypothetical protein
VSKLLPNRKVKPLVLDDAGCIWRCRTRSGFLPWRTGGESLTTGYDGWRDKVAFARRRLVG